MWHRLIRFPMTSSSERRLNVRPDALFGILVLALSEPHFRDLVVWCLPVESLTCACFRLCSECINILQATTLRLSLTLVLLGAWRVREFK
jgi:hypothetical protein